MFQRVAGFLVKRPEPRGIPGGSFSILAAHLDRFDMVAQAPLESLITLERWTCGEVFTNDERENLARGDGNDGSRSVRTEGDAKVRNQKPRGGSRVISKREEGHQSASLPANRSDVADLERAGLTEPASRVKLLVDDQPVFRAWCLRGRRDRRPDLVCQISNARVVWPSAST